jgi:hypothetical protein
MVLKLVPRIEIAAPTVSSNAAPVPANVAAASASGVSDCAMPGRVPCATACTATYSAVTIAIMVSSANGTSRFGLRYSPAAAGVFSKPA